MKILRVKIDLKVEIEGVGHAVIERSLRAKNISISVKFPDQVRIAVPLDVSFEKAEQFAQTKASWIKKNIDKFSSQVNLSQHLDSIDTDYAKSYLVGRLKHLANKHGFSYNSVSVRSQKTRWGSCSFNNNISLNIKLICLPKDLSDYVILHELAHTKIKNHSPSFWSFLNQHVLDVKKKDKALKGYSCA